MKNNKFGIKAFAGFILLYSALTGLGAYMFKDAERPLREAFIFPKNVEYNLQPEVLKEYHRLKHSLPSKIEIENVSENLLKGNYFYPPLSSKHSSRYIIRFTSKQDIKDAIGIQKVINESPKIPSIMKPSLNDILNSRKNTLESIKSRGLNKVLEYDGVVEDIIYSKL